MQPEVERIEVSFTLNGEAATVETWPLARLLDVLREELALTGTKEGCGEGECGACSVFVDGVLVNACLVPMAQVAGARVETIEGVAAKAENAGLLDAFVRCNGTQCGICTPGMLIASKALLDRNPNPTDEEIRTWLAGNLCRCTGYVKIVDAVMACTGNEP